MKQPPLPTGERISSSRLKRDFAWLEVVPEDCPNLAFKAFAPKLFTVVKEAGKPPPQGSLLTLASLRNPNSEAGILVQMQPLPREVAAVHWLRLCAQQSGKTIEILDAVSPYFAEAKLSFADDNKSWSARMAVQIAGGDAILILCYSPAATFEQVHDDFGMFIATWELLQKPDQVFVEKREQSALSHFCFQIPASWKQRVAPKIGIPASLIYANLDDAGELNGIIRVASGKLDQSNGWLAALDDAFAFWNTLNLPDSEPMSQTTPEVSVNGINKASLVVVRLWGKGSGDSTFEGWVLILETYHEWISVSLLTPPETDEKRLHVWAFNNRAFKIVCESLNTDQNGLQK